MVTGLDNVKSATNIKIEDVTGRLIAELDDRYCINGIDTIVWDGLNLSPALYVWQMTLKNDCGEQSYWRGFLYGNDGLPIKNYNQHCNNSIQTPIPCCESEPDIYIHDETIEGAGELSFHATHNIEVENTTVEANTDQLIMIAGNEIVLNHGTVIEEGANAVLYIEACANTNTHRATEPGLIYPTPLAEVNDSENNFKEKIQSQSSTIIYPNPFTSELHISFSSTESEKVRCRIFDLNGSIVLKRTFYINGDNFTKTISTSGYKPGMYILKIIADKNVESFKIVKQ